MGFFNSTTGVGSTANIEDLLEEDLNIYDGMSIMEANYAAIAENEMNWNAIMEAAAATEMQYFAENGEEYVYTEASGFLAKVSEFFKKIWEKIKGLFKKFMVMIGQLWTNDKDFVKKYGETIRRSANNIPSGYEIKVYDFKTESGDKIPSTLKELGDSMVAVSGSISGGNISNDTINAIKRMTGYDATSAGDAYDSTEAANKLRGSLIDEGSMTSGEFSKKVAELLRDGKSAPISVKLDKKRVNDALDEIEKAKKTRDDANKVYKAGEAAFKKVIKSMETMESKGYKKKPEDDEYSNSLQVLNKVISLLKFMASDMQTMNSLFLTAVKDRYQQNKRICVKVVTFKTPKNEGASVEHFAEGSAFAGLNLI